MKSAGATISGAVAGATGDAIFGTSAISLTQTDKPTGTGGSAFEVETGNALDHLPRDHAMHGGSWYRCAENQETNFCTGFVWNALFSVTDVQQKKFYQCVQPMFGSLTTKGSGPTVPDERFSVEYELGVDGVGRQQRLVLLCGQGGILAMASQSRYSN